jgi:hypothetical protein
MLQADRRLVRDQETNGKVCSWPKPPIRGPDLNVCARGETDGLPNSVVPPGIVGRPWAPIGVVRLLTAPVGILAEPCRLGGCCCSRLTQVTGRWLAVRTFAVPGGHAESGRTPVSR